MHEEVAARTVQCAWRVFSAKRITANNRLKKWYLRKYVMRVQSAWRCCAAKKQKRRLREHRQASLQALEAEYQTRIMNAFTEGLLWRMSLCETQAAIIQRWYRLSRLRSEQRSTAVTLPPSAEVFLPQPPDTPSGGAIQEYLNDPFEEPPAETPIPIASDIAPPGGYLSAPRVIPPSTGVMTINIRKAERERKQLKVLETTSFIERTKCGDLQHSLKRERSAMERRAATAIQAMFRGVHVREEHIAASTLRSQMAQPGVDGFVAAGQGVLVGS